LDIENGIRLASGRNSRGSAEYEQVRSRVTMNGHSAPHQVDTLGPVMVIQTTRVTQTHDIVKTLQDGPGNAKEILWSEGPWLGEELEKAWENYYEVQGHSPFETCGNDQCRSKDLCVLMSAALPSTSPSSSLHIPFIPSTPSRSGFTMLTNATGAK